MEEIYNTISGIKIDNLFKFNLDRLGKTGNFRF